MSAKIQYHNQIGLKDTTMIDSWYIIRYYEDSKNRSDNKLISAQKMFDIISNDKTWEKTIMKKLNQVWSKQFAHIILRRGIAFRIAFR